MLVRSSRIFCLRKLWKKQLKRWLDVFGMRSSISSRPCSHFEDVLHWVSRGLDDHEMSPFLRLKTSLSASVTSGSSSLDVHFILNVILRHILLSFTFITVLRITVMTEDMIQNLVNSVPLVHANWCSNRTQLIIIHPSPFIYTNVYFLFKFDEYVIVINCTKVWVHVGWRGPSCTVYV